MPAKKSTTKSAKRAATKTSPAANTALVKSVKKTAKRARTAVAKKPRAGSTNEESATGLRGIITNLRETIVGDDAHPSKLALGAQAIGEKVAAAGKLAVKGERLIVEYAAKKLGRKKAVSKKTTSKKSPVRKAAGKKSSGRGAARKASARNSSS